MKMFPLIFMLLCVNLLHTAEALVTSRNVINCNWEWTQWSSCDPGPCGEPRLIQDRIRRIIRPPQDGGNPCPFNVSPTVENYTDHQHSGNSRVEHRPCSTASACYTANNCTIGEFTCKTERCLPQEFRCNGDYDCHDHSDEEQCSSVNLTCTLHTPVEYIKNNKSFDGGLNIISRSQTRPVLSNSFFGSCKQVNTNGQEFRMPHNVDTYTSMNADKGWTTRKFNKFHDLTLYLMQYMKVQVLPQELYSYAVANEDNTIFYVAIYLYSFDKIGMRSPHELELATGLINALKEIPKEKSYEKYFSLFDQYGTDYTRSGLRGGHVFILKAKNHCEEQPSFTQTDNSMSFPEWIDDSNNQTIMVYVDGGDAHASNELKSHPTQANFNRWKPTVAEQPTQLFIDDDMNHHLTGRIHSLLQSRYLILPDKNIIENLIQTALAEYEQPFQKSLCNPCQPPDYLVMMADQPGQTGQYGCICVKMENPVAECGSGSTLTPPDDSTVTIIGGIVVALVILGIIGVPIFVCYKKRKPTIRTEGYREHTNEDSNSLKALANKSQATMEEGNDNQPGPVASVSGGPSQNELSEAADSKDTHQNKELRSTAQVSPQSENQATTNGPGGNSKQDIHVTNHE